MTSSMLGRPVLCESSTCGHQTSLRHQSVGPLEATINNLVRELQRKEVESKDLQRHWINLQTELVARQNENSELSEKHARLSSHFSVLFQKKAALQKSLDCEVQEV